MQKTQIIIPMSGFGERFRRAGYDKPKPLIEILGKPIIAHVIDMFPGEKEFIFICNQDHLSDPNLRMRATLQECCPTGRIVGIPSHKLGPVHAVLQIANLVDLERPVVVNYCDFACYWNWEHFKRFVTFSKCEGVIPAYKGFHPHTLGSTNYAYVREENGWVTDIQEKQPYTTNRMAEYASSGTYYFKSGRLMFDAFADTVDQNLSVGGEFYVSLAYKPLLSEGYDIVIYPLQHFMQWGTPEDVIEFTYWADAFARLSTHHKTPIATSGSLIVPMAGLGQRFVNEGYELTKPLIHVSGLPMVVQATHDLSVASHHVFVLRSNMPGGESVCNELRRIHPMSIVKMIDFSTEGQACTALIGLDALKDMPLGAQGPITIGACDNGVLYDHSEFYRMVNNPDIDVIVWGIRGYPNALRSPEMYGWIDSEEGVIRSISVKTPLAAPASDPIVLGTFTFRREEDLIRVVQRLVARDGRINGEYYLDSCINDAIEIGLKCRVFEVESYLCWGTPNDLRTFEYWQSCFHKWSGHPYRLDKDGRIPAAALEILERRYQATTPDLLTAKKCG